MSTIPFTKMHGQGNDFVMLNGIAHAINLTPAQIRAIADRHMGIGCDQLLVVEKSTRPDVDFRYRIFNADGGEVEQCGNGSRCFAKFVRDQGLTDKTSIRVETLSGIIEPSVNTDGSVTVNMGAPRFALADIPFIAGVEALDYRLPLPRGEITIAALSMGNPHAVQIVDNVDTAPVTTEGPLIERHERFPQRVNVGFLQVVSRTHIRLRVWERGAGETLACGTGACAAVVTGIRWGKLDNEVRVSTRGGDLTVTWQAESEKQDQAGAPVIMRGAAITVFTGQLTL